MERKSISAARRPPILAPARAAASKTALAAVVLVALVFPLTQGVTAHRLSSFAEGGVLEGAPATVPSPPSGSASFENGDEASDFYGVRFKCPAQRGQTDSEVVVIGTFCPNYVIDLEDFLGQPVLSVDPLNPNIMAFHSLHGGIGIHLDPPLGDGKPATERSRFNFLHQPHTTFQTHEGPGKWNDNRYYAPDPLIVPGRVIYGEDNAMTMDAQGNLYLASLYSYRDEGEKGWHFAVATWKGHRANRPVSYYENLQLLHGPDDTEGRDSWVQDLFLTYSPETNRVVILWLERANGTSTSVGLKSWVMAYSTVAGEGLRWDRIPITQMVGPCKRLSRPVAFADDVYFGCLPDEGYRFSQSAVADRWQIHSLNTSTLASRYRGPTPVLGPEGILVDFAHTGHMLFIGTDIDSDGRPHVYVSKGALGSNWTDPKDFGEKLVRAPPGVRVVGARVTAAAYTEQTGFIHLIYQERYASNADPGQIAAGQVRIFNKTYAVLRWGGDAVRWQGRFDNLHYGQPVSIFHAGPVYKGLGGDALFDDLHDDIVVWHDPKTHKERIFTIFDDYGMVRFAEAVEENPPFAIPLPPLGPPPIPLAAEAANATAQTAAAGVLATLMLLRLLLSKKKSTMKVTA